MNHLLTQFFAFSETSTNTFLHAIFLGIVQGLTEFFPVSSSGHLELTQRLLGLTDLHHYVFFNLICHLGTLCALIYVFREDILQILKADRTRLLQILIGTLPLFPLALAVKPLKGLFDQPENLGFAFLITAGLLLAGIRLGAVIPSNLRWHRRWKDALTIGAFQALAIIPGVSRSGSTISAGRLLGWEPMEAIRFSFLLAIPAVLGGIALELLQLFREPAALSLVSPSTYLAGFAVSGFVGFFALHLMMRLATKDRFIYFVWYCLFIGIFTAIYFH